MTLPLLAHSKLFWYYNGQIDCCWYLGFGDSTSVAKQDAYIRDMDRFGIDTITPNICNEGMSSPFSGEFMVSTPHEGKMNCFANFCQRLKNAGKKIVLVYFDFPGSPDGKDSDGKPLKYPFWKYKERIPDFLKIATIFTAPYVDGFLLGIETNRQPGPSIEEVEAGISIIRQHAVKTVDGNIVHLPVGTHEQNVGRDNHDNLRMNRRVPITATVVGYETSNHPFHGGDVSVSRMVEEVTFLVANSGGRPVCVIEANEREDDHAKAQWNAIARIPGVAWVGGPM